MLLIQPDREFISFENLEVGSGDEPWHPATILNQSWFR